MNDIFKRLTAKFSKPQQAQKPAAKPRKPANKTSTIILGSIAVLVLLLAGAYFVFEAEISSTYDTFAQYFGNTSPVEQKHVSQAPIVHNLPVISSVIATSPVTSTTTLIQSSVIATSMVIEADVASGVSQTVSGVVVAQSDVASTDTVFESAPSNSPSLAGTTSNIPTPHQATATRPHNRDVRHCLNLKSNEAIARCVYPK